jgi:hypothetical protein
VTITNSSHYEAIVRSSPPCGRFEEGIIAAGQTPYPGTVMQFTNAPEIQGRKTWTAYAPGASGDRPLSGIAVLLPDWLIGQTCETAYVAGARCQLYFPKPGEELNMLIDASVTDTGTGTVSLLVTQMLSIENNTGILILTTNVSAPFELMDEVDYPPPGSNPNTLARCKYNGY